MAASGPGPKRRHRFDFISPGHIHAFGKGEKRGRELETARDHPEFHFPGFSACRTGIWLCSANNLAGRTAGGPGRISLFVRLTFDSFHVGGADLGGRREHRCGNIKRSFLQYRRRHFNSPPGQPADACDRQGRDTVRLDRFCWKLHC